MPKTVVLNIWGLVSPTFAWAAAAGGHSLCSEMWSCVVGSSQFLPLVGPQVHAAAILPGAVHAL